MWCCSRSLTVRRLNIILTAQTPFCSHAIGRTIILYPRLEETLTRIPSSSGWSECFAFFCHNNLPLDMCAREALQNCLLNVIIHRYSRIGKISLKTLRQRGKLELHYLNWYSWKPFQSSLKKELNRVGDSGLRSWTSSH